ncbi:glycosyltransferase family A protein [Polynucleobacter sp. UB-Raua-W9]|uniref:glycosyltransferase family 2 protein n=1 Tax=Polynucleobacter sp. UB-Raua-W9 TaxID=1819736 RepID=UPI001BFE975B|nr:glycosyltransferase family A protein [Polynucleobacter sp. UB-Raua-W9]QWD72748.1 glycosyltransferase family 2 protein [Polynucleobacter sp. UB-Raua-W9]
MSNCKVSVVIPTKNAGLLFEAVLKQVLLQKTKWPFEVLVVDSGSSDSTISVVRENPSVRLIEIAPSEFGHGKTRNFAIENSTGEFIVMITQDALPINRDWLAEMVSAADQDLNIAGVFGRHIAHSDASIFCANELDQHFLSFLKMPIVKLDDSKRYLADEGYRQYLYFFSDNNALIRRSVWNKIPYPEVDFAEDQAWARLIVEAGFHKAYAHKAVVAHSHNYGYIERLQRSFDETYALQRLFGYGGVSSFIGALRGFVAITRRDLLLFIKANRRSRTDWISLMHMPIDNLMRMLGAYLGTHGNKIPIKIRIYLSRDKKLMNA